jgi:hypothetical protein
MLSSIQWQLWSALTLQAMTSRSPLHPGCGKSGHIDADRLELLGAGYLLFPVASPMRSLKVFALGWADSRPRLGEVLFLVG